MLNTSMSLPLRLVAENSLNRKTLKYVLPRNAALYYIRARKVGWASHASRVQDTIPHKSEVGLLTTPYQEQNIISGFCSVIFGVSRRLQQTVNFVRRSLNNDILLGIVSLK